MESALRSDRQRADGRRLHQAPTPASSRERLGREPTEGELYIAHFLGPTGASRLIGLADSQPGTPAAAVFPSAGARQSDDLLRRARQRAQRGRGLSRRWSAATTSRAAAATSAAVRSPPSAATAASSAWSARQAALRARHASCPTETVCARPRACRRRPRAPTSGPVFHGLFRSAAPRRWRRWSARCGRARPASGRCRARAAPAAAGHDQRCADDCAGGGASSTPAGAARSGGELDLFQEQLPDARALFRGRV